MSLEVAGLIASYGLDAMNYYRGLEDVERAAHGNAKNVAGAFSGINWGSATSGLSGAIGNITGSLGRIAEFAIGGILVQGVQKLAGAIVSLGREALGAVGSYERLNMSLESLIARELRNASAVTETVKVGQQRVQLTEAETAKLAELGRERDLQAAKLQEETERHRQLTLKWGEEGLAVKTHAAQMAELSAQLGETTAEYAKLAGKQGQVVDITQTNTKFTKTLADVQGEAAVKAQELVRWTEELAIYSPFDQEGVAAAYKTALSFGFVSESMDANVVSAKRLTQAMIDYAAGSGQSDDAMARISRAMGKIKTEGKLTGETVMQLTDVGINVTEILAKEFGKSTAEIIKMREAGLIPADKAILALTKSFESDFGGAAKNSTNTVNGLLNSLGDVKKIGLRELFTGIFEALKPLGNGLVELFLHGGLREGIHAFGVNIGTALTGFITKAQEVIGFIQRGELLMAIRSLFGPDAVLPLGGFVLGVQSKVNELKAAFDTGGWPAVGQKLLAYLGQAFTELSAYVTANWPTWQTQIGGAINRIWDSITDWWATSGQALAKTVLGHIGAWLLTLAGQIWAALPGWIETLKGVVGQLWSAFVRWWETGGAQLTLDVLGKIVGWIGTLVTALIAQIPALSQTLLGVVGALWKVFITWWDTGGAVLVGDTILKIASWIGDLVTKAVAELPSWNAKLGGMIGDLWRTFVKWWDTGGAQLTLDVLGKIVGWIGTLVTALIAQIPTLSQTLLGMIGDLWRTFVKWWDTGGEQLTADTIKQIGAWLLAVLGEFDKKSVEWGQATAARLQTMWQNGLDAWAVERDKNKAAQAKALETWWQGMLDAWAVERDQNKAATAKAIGAWWQGVIAHTNELVAWDTALSKAGADVLTGFIAGLDSQFKALENKIKDAAKTIRDAIPDPAQLLYNVGRDIIAGLAQGIIDMKDHLLRKAQELFDALPVWARKLLGIAAPPKALEAIGQETMAGFALGLTGSAKAVQAPLGEMLESLGPVLSSITNTIQAIIAEFAALAGWAASPNSGFGGAKAVLEPLSDMLAALQGVLEGLDALAEFVPRANLAAKIVPLLESIKAIVRGFADLAGWAADPAHGFGGAQAVLAPLGEMLASLAPVLDAVTALAAYDTALAKTQAGAARVIEALKVVVGKLAELNRTLDPAELTDALDLARVLGLLAEGLAAVPTLLETINGALSLSERLLRGFVTPDVAQLRRVGAFIAQLVTAVGEAAALVDVELRDAAIQLATSVGPVLTSVSDALNVLADLRSYIVVPDMNLLRWQMFQITWFIKYLAEGLGVLGKDIHALVYAGAQKLLEVAGPTLVAVKLALELVAGVGDFPVVTDMNLLRWKMFQVTWFIKYLAESLGVLGKDIHALVYAGAQRLLEVAGPALAAVKLALALVVDVQKFVVIPDMNLLRWQMFQITWFIKYLVESLGVFGKDIHGLVYEGAQKLAAVAGPALALVKTALEAIAAVRDYVPVPSLNAIDKSLQQLVTFIQRLVNLLGTATALITEDVLTAAAKLAATAGAALGLIKTGIDALTAIKDYVPLPSLNAVDKSLQQLVTFIQRVVNLLGTATPLITDDLMTAAAKLATAAGPALGLIKTGIDALVAIRDYVPLPSLNVVDVSLQQLATFIKRVVNLLGAASALITDELMTAAQKLATAAGPALGIIKTGVDALVSIKDYVLLPSLNAVDKSLQQLVTFIQRVVNLLGTATPLITDALLAAAQKLAAAAGPALGIIKTGVDALTAIKDYVPPSALALDTFITDIGQLVLRLSTWASGNLTDALVKAAQNFGAATATLFSGLGGAFTALTSVQEYVGPTEDALNRFMADVFALVNKIATWAAGNLTEESAKAAGLFGDATGGLFGGLADAVSVFKDLQSYIPVLNSRIQGFLDSVTYAYSLIEDYASHAGVQAATEATTAFATAAGGVFGMLGTALGVVKQLTDGAASSALTFKIRMADLIERIAGTLHAWRAYVAQEDLVSWLPTAAEFGTALEQVFGVLERALNLFTALGEHGLPSMAQFQDFLDYVAAVMQSMAGGLGGGGDAESLGEGLGSAIGHGMALGMFGATAEVQAAARQLALAVEPGLAGLLGGSYTVTSERRVVVEFTGQAGGGVPLDPAQFELLKSALAYEIRIGA